MHIHIHSQIATGSYFHESGGDEKPSQISGIPGCMLMVILEQISPEGTLAIVKKALHIIKEPATEHSTVTVARLVKIVHPHTQALPGG